jgi:autotransporter adhesin
LTLLSDVQVANVAIASGWRGDDAVTAVAIGLAETDGRPDDAAVGDVSLETAKWGPSIGIWQCRTLKAERGTGSDRDELALKGDARRQGSAAFHIWQEKHNKFTPWTTYVDGKYLLFMPRAKAAVAGKTVNDDGSASATGDTTRTGPLAGVANAVELAAHAGKWMGDPHNWLRVGLAVVGGGLVLGGLLVMARPEIEKATQAAQSVASSVPVK